MRVIIKALNKGSLTIAIKLSLLMAVLTALPFRLLAAITTNPWAGGGAPVDPGNLEQTVGTKMSSTLEYILIGSGVCLFLGGIGVFIHLLNKSAEDKKDESVAKAIAQIVITIFCIVVGLILVSLGYTGAEAVAAP